MAKNFLSGLFSRKDEKTKDAQSGEAGEPGADDAPTDKVLRDPSARTDADRDVAPAIADPVADSEAGAELNEAGASFTAPERARIDAARDDAAQDEAAPDEADDGPKRGWFSRLKSGLSKSSSRLSDGVQTIFVKRKLDAEAIDELEELLLTADLGVAASARIADAMRKARFEKDANPEAIREALAAEIEAILAPHEKPLTLHAERSPHVILAVGVNGAGKTTTIGKLAAAYKRDGKSVMLAAGDTFRAAAIEQLEAWGERAGARVVSRAVGADAAGLAFDALKEAQAENADILIIDTAGRLQNKAALMDELAKIVRVVKKIDPGAPHDVLLTLDATVGQNALSQAESFEEIAGVTGIVMTKLDGTARGGVLVALAQARALPIHFVGVGEAAEDLQPFRARAFSRALVGLDA